MIHATTNSLRGIRGEQLLSLGGIVCGSQQGGPVFAFLNGVLLLREIRDRDVVALPDCPRCLAAVEQAFAEVESEREHHRRIPEQLRRARETLAEQIGLADMLNEGLW